MDKLIAPFRVGFGYDVHPFAEGRQLWLGGVNIPFTKGLLGHSDADVLLHALADALLGAAALGDIGLHFPNTDPRYDGADSRLLLAEAYGKVVEAGYRLGNADCTVVAEVPKIMPYAAAMQQAIANALDNGITTDVISIKATTNERMGFVGREEGIAAFAVALLFRA